MLKLFLIVGLGGAMGSILRYFTAVLFAKWHVAVFPYATFTVNIIGCFLIGMLFSSSEKFGWPGSNLRLLLITGFCGGLTTFSTFAYENIKLLQDGNTSQFLLYSISSYIAGLLAVVAGINIVKLF